MWPTEIIAVDWGSTPAKRQLCRAVLRGKRYNVEKPVTVVDPASMELPPGALVAFDCPIGLSREYAEAAGLAGFRDVLPQLGHGRLERFYEVATTPSELSLERPFYPARSTGATRDQLRLALGEPAFALRSCDRATGAGPLFWLVGAKQCGRSSIQVWRDVITPHLADVALWPFDGPLDLLVATGKPVIAEMYPAFLARWLGLDLGSKRDQRARAEAGRQIVDTTKGVELIAVRDALLDGFGPTAAGEDPFDAVLAAIALVRLVTAGNVPEPPDEVRAIEGWILGL